MLYKIVRNTFLDIFPSFYFHQETVLCHHRAHTLYHYHRRAALSLPASSGTCSTMAPAALSEEIEPRNALDSERRKQDSRERRTRNTTDLAVSWPVPHLWRRMREWQTADREWLLCWGGNWPPPRHKGPCHNSFCCNSACKLESDVYLF